MSRQSTKRASAIDKDFTEIERGAAKVVSDLVRQVDLVKLLVVFLHDNVLNERGDLTEGDRLDVRNSLVPLYPQVEKALQDIVDLFTIHDDNPVVWRSNLEAYLDANPTLLSEALGRYPEVS